MKNRIYTIVYGNADYEYYSANVLVEGSYKSLEDAKKALVEIVKSIYIETLEALGEDFLDMNFSDDGMEFIDDDEGEGECQMWKIIENTLN